MASLKHLTKLFEAISKRDWSTAENIALTVAEDEERIGHHAAAQRLRGSLRPNGHAIDPHHQRSVGPSDEREGVYFLTSALTQMPADRDLSAVRLKPANRGQLKDVVMEWRRRDELAKRRLNRRIPCPTHQIYAEISLSCPGVIGFKALDLYP